MKLQPIYRITVFVPRENLTALVAGIKAVCRLGDDRYDSVLWYVEQAREQYRPLPGAQPARGRIGDVSDEAVSMLLFSLPRDDVLLARVLEEGVNAHHPWEAPGIFIDEAWMPASA